MRQIGHLSLATPALFFALAFLAVAGAHSPAGVDVTVSPVSCPSGRATVTLTAGSGLDREAGFAVYRNGRAVLRGRIGPRGRRSVAVGVPPGGSARVTVKVDGQSTVGHTLRSWCGWPHPHPAATERPPSRAGHSLPAGTGSRPSPPASRKDPRRPLPVPASAPLTREDTPATVAGWLTDPWGLTLAAGALLAAGLLGWYGWIWPRRVPREPIDPNRSPYGARRYPAPSLQPPAPRPPLPPGRRPLAIRPPRSSRRPPAIRPPS